MKVERAVVDTNVLISAVLSPRSVSAQLVNGLLEQARLVFFKATFDELETRLWRPKFDRHVDTDQRRQLLRNLAAVALWIDVTASPQSAYSRDPGCDVLL